MTRVAPRGLLFDKDGTLFDFAATWQVWAERFLDKIDASEDAARAIGFDRNRGVFARNSVVIAGTPDDITARLSPHVPHLSKGELIAVINREAAQTPQREAVPLVPFLSGLREAGYLLGVATNDAEAPARAHLASVGVDDSFDFIAGFDSGHGSKPGPGQLHAFAEAMDLPAAACIMVGDSLHDLHAAQAAGMRAVGVLTGAATAAVLQPFAETVLPDIGALPGWLAALDGHG